VTTVEEHSGLDVAAAGADLRGRHRAIPAPAVASPAPRAGRAAAPEELFTRFALDYAAQHRGRPICVLQAGCSTAGSELDLAAIRRKARQVAITLVDEDSEPARATVAGRHDLRTALLGELNSVPLPPRSFDLVQCSMLLHRIDGAELVLGRLVAALRPGGLLLLRTADRGTAAGFLDRRLPRALRAMAWRAARPGQPGPFPASYEQIASVRGVEAFVTRHGLAIAHRQVCRSADSQGGHVGPNGVPTAERIVTWLSRGRLTCSYDELRYVIRKPEDRFARVLAR
jgi:SAM-dependent methyltransferase